MKKKLSIAEELKHEQEYVAFLKKRLESTNYKNNVSADEFNETSEKYKKAKFRLRLLENK